MINTKSKMKEMIMMAQIHKLVICHTCHTRVKKGEAYTIWESSVYCESCFDLYMELIDDISVPNN